MLLSPRSTLPGSADIGLHGDAAPFRQPVGDPLRGVDVEVPGGHEVAASDELFGHRRTHPGACAGDDDSAAAHAERLAGPSMSGLALSAGQHHVARIDRQRDAGDTRCGVRASQTTASLIADAGSIP